MVLIVDTGPLLAAIDRRDAHHDSCRDLLDQFPEPVVVPASVLVELDYLVRKRLPRHAHPALLREITEGGLTVLELRREDYIRVREICGKYSDADIGLVDASIVAIAERLNEPKVATLDHRHFRLIQPRHVDALELLPH